jgi:GT2 family glycosyltransferase
MSGPRSIELSVVIPTLNREGKLRRALTALGEQDIDAERFEVQVVFDQASDGPVPDLGSFPFRVHCDKAKRPGASAARNLGVERAASDLILFIDDDVLASPRLIGEHLRWHERDPARETGVLGRMVWASEIKVTPFMRWLESGIQFDYPNILGTYAGWGRFYTANVSVKRSMVEAVGGFDEVNLPYGYEDLDLSLRMREHGFELLYNEAALAEHLHEMDVEMWKRRVRRIARAERQFCVLHPEFEPYFFNLFRIAADAPRASGRGAFLIGRLPRRTPVLGKRAWRSADMFFRQLLAPGFLEEWHRDTNTPPVPLADGAQSGTAEP